jgi:hypothetical protein
MCQWLKKIIALGVDLLLCHAVLSAGMGQAWVPWV